MNRGLTAQACLRRVWPMIRIDHTNALLRLITPAL